TTAGQVYYIGVNGSSASDRAYDPITGAGAAAGDGGDYVLEVSNAFVTFGGKQKATYIDASGDLVTMAIKGPGTGTVRFPGGDADCTLNTASKIKAIKATQWLDTDASADTITAPLVKSINVRGEFGASVTTDNLGSAKVGALNGSDVRAGTTIGTITAGSAS